VCVCEACYLPVYLLWTYTPDGTYWNCDVKMQSFDLETTKNIKYTDNIINYVE